MNLEILYQDQDYVAVHKPPGLLVHRTSLDKDEDQAVVQLLKFQLKQTVFPVHRLDKPTSGVLILAKSSEAARKLSEEFFLKKIEKKYLAIVRGHFKEEILLNYPLRLEIEKDAKQKLQEAQTFFRPISSMELAVQIDRYPTSRISLVQAFPKTGRTHQIRRHLKHLNYPIIGDVNHGNGKHNKYFFSVLGISGMMLSCIEINFTHPSSQEKTIIKSDLPSQFKNALVKLGFNYDPAT